MHFHQVHETAPAFMRSTEDAGSGIGIDNIYFSQAMSNPFDMMSSMAFLLAGGVCERYPDLRLIFLEANGGWIVPWLERLDHHCEMSAVQARRALPEDGAVGVLPPPVLDQLRRRRVDARVHGRSPLVGADRIMWASDYPHPDAKFPGTTDELYESIEDLDEEQQRQIAGDNAVALYDL